MKYLIYLLLIKITIQQCQDGCLQCNNSATGGSTQVCKLCDASNNYYLKDNQCKIQNIDFCQNIDPFTGECLMCKSEYYLDNNTKKCVSIQIDKKILNCEMYDSNQNCLQCKPQFYLSGNKCEQVSQIIQNCKIYNTATNCQQCDDNNYLTLDTKECKGIRNNLNCLIFSQYECQKCKTGYLLDYTVYQNKLYETNPSQNLLRQLYDFVLNDGKNKRTINDYIKVCQKIDILNCKEYKDFKECSKCENGYYLKKGKCEKNPQDKIPNCQLYQTQTKCLNCEQGYILKSSSECLMIKEEQKIQNCNEYKTNTSAVQCKLCANQFFLSSNSCKERQNLQIQNCQVLNPDGDNCFQCNAQYILTSDKFCAMQISNCQTQISNKSSDGTYSSYCTKCEPRFYLNVEKQCQQGTIQNCEIYFDGTNQCSQCQNQFFLDNQGNCFPHDQIDNCTLYSNTQQNICEICEQGYYGLEVINKCVERNQIPYCAQYTFQNNQSVCQSCEDGFYLQNNYCVNIPIQQCKKFDGVNCMECQDNLALVLKIIDQSENKQLQCAQPFQYIYENCSFESNVNNKSNNQKCQVCEMNHFPYKNEKDFICIDQYKQDETDGCLSYDFSGLCLRCQPGRYSINGGLQCVSNCSSSFHLFTTSVNNSIIDIKNINTCSIGINNELIIAPAVQDKSNITIKCKDWIQVTENLEGANKDILYSNVDINNNNGQYQILDPLQVTNAVKCPNYQSLARIDGVEVTSQQNPRDCELYYDFGFQQYGCIKCPFGMRGNYVGYPYPVQGTTSLSQCNYMFTCESGIKYKNINSYWNQFFSCHKCTNSTSIPVLIPLMYGLNTADVKGFTEINKNSLTNETDVRRLTNFLYYPLMCVDTISEASIAQSLNIDSDRATSQYINKLDGCGLAVYNFNYTNSNFDNTSAYNQTPSDFPTDNKLAIFCVTCKPGYKAYYWNNQKNVVRYCEKIEGCQMNGLWFNACQQCQDGYLHAYDSVNGIKYDKCVKIPQNNIALKNCYAYQQDSSVDYSGICKVCNKGFYLNLDNYCEQVNVSRCNQGLFQHYDNEIVNIKNTKWAYYLYQNGYGCTECQQGSFALDVQSLSVKEYCVYSEYISYHNNNLPKQSNKSESNFVDNCLMYENDFSVVKCSRCKLNYILRDDGSECVEMNYANNCKLLQNFGTNCKICHDGYALLSDGSCQIGNIQNCIAYFSEESKSNLQCKQCEQGFYLEQDNVTCSMGLVQGCKIYKNYDQFTCEECYDSLVLSQDQKYCFQKIDNMNCKKPSITPDGYKCTQSDCGQPWAELVQNNQDPNNYQQQMGIVRGVCLQVNKIDNCKLYSQLTSSWSEFSCKECEQNFYLSQDSKQCLQRKNMDSNCKEYLLNKDECKICYDGFYIKLEQNINKCIQSPNGEQNCQEYIYTESQGLNCQLCKKGYYLLNKECQLIPTESIVQNCEIHSALGVCQECSTNYKLENNNCVKIAVSNCLELASSTSCLTCLNGFRLIKQDNNNICESFTKANCLIYEQTGDNKCIQCNQDFYPDVEGNCQKVSKPIPECLLYVSENICQQCSENFVLSVSASQCLPKQNYDQNCEQQKLTNDLKCNLCKAGYQIKGSICQPYLMNGPNSGCFMPDTNDQSQCYICQIGYYMGQDKKCIRNQGNQKKQDDEKIDIIGSTKLNMVFYMIFMAFI